MSLEVEAVIIQPDGTATVTKIRPELNVITGLVGGWLEAISPTKGNNLTWHGYVDEEGKIDGKPGNAAATVIASRLGWDGVRAGDFVVGTLVILGATPTGNEADVPAGVVSVVQTYYTDKPSLLTDERG